MLERKKRRKNPYEKKISHQNVPLRRYQIYAHNMSHTNFFALVEKDTVRRSGGGEGREGKKGREGKGGRGRGLFLSIHGVFNSIDDLYAAIL